MGVPEPSRSTSSESVSTVDQRHGPTVEQGQVLVAVLETDGTVRHEAVEVVAVEPARNRLVVAGSVHPAVPGGAVERSAQGLPVLHVAGAAGDGGLTSGECEQVEMVVVQAREQRTPCPGDHFVGVRQVSSSGTTCVTRPSSTRTRAGRPSTSTSSKMRMNDMTPPPWR